MLPANFAKIVKQKILQNEVLFKSSSAEALAFVRTLQKEVRDAIVMAKGFSVSQLDFIRKELESAASRMESGLQKTVSANQDAAWKVGASSLPDSFKAVGIKVKFATLPDKLLIATKGFSASLITDLASEVVDKISADLRYGIVSGSNPYKTMERIDTHLFTEGEGVSWRAETIVRTENMRVYELANQERFAQAKELLPKLKKIWIASDDERTRDDHRQAAIDYAPGGDPGPIPTDEPFIVGGVELMFPVDPEGDPHQVINCRCTSQPWMDNWAEDVQPLQEGGSGSGNFGHSGRPGEVGGSSSEEGGGETSKSSAKNYTDMDPVQLHTSIAKAYGVEPSLTVVNKIPVVMPDGKTVQATGRYNPRTSEIEIAQDALFLPSNVNKIGYTEAGTAGMGWQATVIHETAHAIDIPNKLSRSSEFKELHLAMITKLTDDGAKGNYGGFVSKYAWSNEAENFAESFAVFKLNPSWLEKNNKPMYDYMRRVK